MTKTDIIRKLTSRKFWMALALFVTGLITAFGGEAETAETVAGCIMQGAAVLSYILAEGWADAASNGAPVVMNGIAVEDLETE
jgi:hypothetical protein